MSCSACTSRSTHAARWDSKACGWSGLMVVTLERIERRMPSGGFGGGKIPRSFASGKKRAGPPRRNAGTCRSRRSDASATASAAPAAGVPAAAGAAGRRAARDRGARRDPADQLREHDGGERGLAGVPVRRLPGLLVEPPELGQPLLLLAEQ